MIVEKEEDHDRVEYTGVTAAEDLYSWRFEEFFHPINYSNNEERTKFITDEEYRAIKDQKIVFDVLPSFEMFQSLHSRLECIPAALPPDYFHDSMCLPSSQSSNPSILTSISAEHSIVSGSFDATSSSCSSESSPFDNILGPQGAMTRSIADNVHNLPSMPVHPQVTVDIHITKSEPKPLQKPESESTLKEYTSGDAVNGYIVISNLSAYSVPFHMFNVTLEGITSVADTSAGKIYNKRFLNMLDMNASWTFGCVSASNNIRYDAGTKDWDGCTIGLSEKRILEPKTKYKKFFFFKFPHTLLDSTCPHQQELHTLLPPSFGVDRYKNKGEHSLITVNSALHYGHNGTRGSPLLMKDLAGGNLSVSYSINAALIGPHPDLKDGAGRPELAVMRFEQHSLRFIPRAFWESSLNPENDLERLKQSVQASFKNAERFLMLNEKSSEEEVRKLDYDIKIQHPHIEQSTKRNNEKCGWNFSLRNGKYATPNLPNIEVSMTYVSRRKKSFLGELKRLNETGLMQISTCVPKNDLSYVSPPLIRKANQVLTLNGLGIQNIKPSSNIRSISGKKKLKHLEFQLKFSPSDMCSSRQPPEIGQICSSLLVINVYSTCGIPITMSSDILMNQSDGLQQMKSDFGKYDETNRQLHHYFLEKGFDLNRFLDIPLQESIKALKEMKFDTFKLPVFKSRVDDSGQWAIKNGRWMKNIKLSLDYHESITETLVPNFQTCLFSRIYYINVEFKFRNCSMIANMRVPINLSWFGGDP